MSKSFYRAFEDRHRGSPELIRGRLTAYLPFIEPLRELYQPPYALDLGCGRGEWLELLQDNNFQPHGIDLDVGMLADCTARGLPVTQGDAIAHLKLLDDDSQCIVSGFHIAEHIAFDDLQTLVIHALRVLKPGGLLILETPNPENLVVGTSSFYLDPTHLRPIPPLLLSFLTEYHGFARSHTVRLQETPELHQLADIRLMDVLGGTSPDYAIVAQKVAPPELLERFNVAFAAQYGIELNELAGRFDSTWNKRINALDQRLVAADGRIGVLAAAMASFFALQDRPMQTDSQAESVQTEIAPMDSRAERVMRCIEVLEAQTQLMELRELEQQQQAAATEALALAQLQRMAAVEERVLNQQKQIYELSAIGHQWQRQVYELEVERNALRQSASWRITAPMRFAAGLVAHPLRTLRSGANVVIHRAICSTERPLSRLMAAVLRRPQLSNRINSWLLRYPALYRQLIGVARRGGLVPGTPVYSPPAGLVDLHASPDLASLTPRARQIYADLQAAIENKQGTS